jgi:hypothetical protein
MIGHVHVVSALDVKLRMTVSRMENGVAYVELFDDERNLNDEICAILTASHRATLTKTQSSLTLKPSDLHYVQLTAIAVQSDCLHVIVMHEAVIQVMNVLKEWQAKKQPIRDAPKPGMLVCAQFDADDLWYRAQVKSLTGRWCECERSVLRNFVFRF